MSVIVRLLVQVEMLSHFGSEHFCPLSMLRVFGTTMMEEYEYSESQRDQNKQQHQQSNGEGAGGGRLGASGDHGDDESPTIPVNPGERETSSTLPSGVCEIDPGLLCVR